MIKKTKTAKTKDRWHLVRMRFDGMGSIVLVEAIKPAAACKRARDELYRLALRSPAAKRAEPPPNWARKTIGSFAAPSNECTCPSCNPASSEIKRMLDRYLVAVVVESGPTPELASRKARGARILYLDPAGNPVERGEAFRRYRRLRAGYRIDVDGEGASSLAASGIEQLPLPSPAKRTGFQVPVTEEVTEARAHRSMLPELPHPTNAQTARFALSWQSAVSSLSYVPSNLFAFLDESQLPNR